MPDALASLASDLILQPLLFKAESRFFIKLDNTAMPVIGESCFLDAIHILFSSFHVFNDKYPHELLLVYGLFEKIVGIKSTVGRSVAVRQFLLE